MNTQLSHPSRFDKLTIFSLGLCISLFPLFFLTIRGWVNVCLFIASLLSIIYIGTNHRNFYKNKTKTYWVLLFALCSPFLTELIAQIFRAHIHTSSLDGPLRFLLAGFVYIALYEIPHQKIKLNFEWVIPTSLIICLATYFLNPSASHFWGGRAASYFADPITFASYITALSFVCLIFLKQRQHYLINPLIITAFVSGIYLIVLSQSRSAWTSCIIAGLLIPLIQIKTSKKAITALLLLIVLSCFSAYYFDDIVKNRTDTALLEIIQYFNGNRDTSTGIRISLARLDFYLFYSHWLTGIQDGVSPPLQELKQSQGYITEALYSMKLLAGSHNEMLAQISRKGIWGVVSIFGLFIIPIIFFIKHIRSSNEKNCVAAKIGLIFCTSILVSSLTIQVFNLKFTSSFYALMLAVLFASVLKESVTHE